MEASRGQRIQFLVNSPMLEGSDRFPGESAPTAIIQHPDSLTYIVLIDLWVPGDKNYHEDDRERSFFPGHVADVRLLEVAPWPAGSAVAPACTTGAGCCHSWWHQLPRSLFQEAAANGSKDWMSLILHLNPLRPDDLYVPVLLLLFFVPDLAIKKEVSRRLRWLSS